MIVVDHSERPRLVRFAPFEMDLLARQLNKNGRKVKLQDQPFNILEHLALRAKEPVLREKLYHYLPSHNSYDPKHGLDSAIQKIRKALHDSAENPRFVETLRGHGYRFMKDVECEPPVNHDSSHASSSSEDAFLSTLSQLHRELFTTYGSKELSRLFHRVTGLLDQHRDHPKRSEAWDLLESIQEARSQDNISKHKISFESAALVFEDRQALSIPDHGTETWHTLGRVQRGFWHPVTLLVSHEIHQNKSWISSARKATPIEREAYDLAKKKTDR